MYILYTGASFIIFSTDSSTDELNCDRVQLTIIGGKVEEKQLEASPTGQFLSHPSSEELSAEKISEIYENPRKTAHKEMSK